MTAQVTVRAARPADAAPIARVHVETWRTTYAGILPDAYLVRMTETEQVRQWDALIRHLTRPEAVVVAEAVGVPGGRIVGFSSCGRARGRPCCGEVYTLYVAPDWQGRGIGRRLLHRMLAALHAGGLHEALVWVLSDNPARFFYEAMGGRRAAERREPFAGIALEEAAYVWPDLARWLAEQGGGASP